MRARMQLVVSTICSICSSDNAISQAGRIVTNGLIIPLDLRNNRLFLCFCAFVLLSAFECFQQSKGNITAFVKRQKKFLMSVK